jgi:hypothetical protein
VQFLRELAGGLERLASPKRRDYPIRPPERLPARTAQLNISERRNSGFLW